jgi:hypothetical protein
VITVFDTLTPCEIYDFVQKRLHEELVMSRGEALKTVVAYLTGSPSIAAYWLLPQGTPAQHRVWPSPKRRCA